MRHRTDPGGSEVNETPTSWMAYARCRDLPPEVFFPSDGVGVAVAQQYCAVCPVAGDCLDYALENHIEHGVWGGASERSRRRMTRSRRRSEVMSQGAAPAGRAGQNPVPGTSRGRPPGPPHQ
jgi:WhiB family redox-sensing transcriptional regulator